MLREVVQVAAGYSACLPPRLKAAATRSSISGDAGSTCSLAFATVRYEEVHYEAKASHPDAGCRLTNFFLSVASGNLV